LWHDAYNFYAENLPRLSPAAELEIVRLWQDHGDEPARPRLLEAFYYIVRPIAGEIATKRFPPALFPSQKVPGKRNIAKDAYDGQRDRIQELASVGICGLLVAANRFDPSLGYRFSTHANDWVDKYIRLYCEEIVGVVPRTGHMGIEEQGINSEGEPWIVYKPRRSVMDLIEAALDGRRLYRGKAAGGMAVFDAGLLIDGKEAEDGSTLPDFEYLSSEGPTREYLQRRVGVGGARFIWKDQGSDAGPRIYMPISREVVAPWDKPDPIDEVEFTRGKREEALPKGPKLLQAPQPAEICYLAKPRPDRQFDSRSFEKVKGWQPKPLLMPEYSTPHWTNSLAFAQEYLSRSKDRKEIKHENAILRRADAVQTSAGVSRRRRERRTTAHDLPQQYCREALLEKLSRDGICPVPSGTPAAA